MFGLRRYFSLVSSGGSEQFLSLLNAYPDGELPSLLTQKFFRQVSRGKKNIVSKYKMKKKKIYNCQSLNYFTSFNPF
jgi:hypothetical protein